MFFQIHTPSWNSEGTEIAFVSDRGSFISGEFDGQIYNHDYGQTDIYIVNANDGHIKRITETKYNESHPVWANTRRHYFTLLIIMVFGIYFYIR